MKSYLFLFLILVSCHSPNLDKEVELNISIRVEQSSVVDLSKKVYTVFYIQDQCLYNSI
jgi:hypothetical protein